MIRTTTNGTISRTLYDLQAAAERLHASQGRLSTGKAIGRPEDDPFGAGRAVTLRGELGDVRQYQRNVDEANAWLDASDTALSNSNGVLQRVRELVVGAANGTVDASGLSAVATEVGQLRAALREQMNSTFAGRYLFAGTRTTPAPSYGGPFPDSPPSYAYVGDGNLLTRAIADGEQIPVNLVGSMPGDPASTAVFDTTASTPPQNVLATLDAIERHLRGGTAADRAALGGADLRLLDDHLDHVIQGRATIGARSNRLDTQLSRLKDTELNVQDILSKTEDADMAKTILEYSTQQAGYQAALQAGARVIQPSLLDFLH